MRSIIWKLERAYWWLQHRFNPRHRYNLIKTGLRAGYWDPRERITWAVFELITEFVDEVKDVIDWSHAQEHQRAWDAFTAAAEWWKANKADYFEFVSLENDDRRDEEARKHLIAVVSNIGFLWYP